MTDNVAIEEAGPLAETEGAGMNEAELAGEAGDVGAAPGTEAEDPNALGLAVIVTKLRELGLVPEGDFDIAEATCAALQVLIDQNLRLNEELAAANTSLAEAAKAAAAGKAAPAAKPPKVRKIDASAVTLQREGDKDARDAALLAAIAAAETVELAFSNGKNEIASLEPVTIMGNAWRATMVGVQLTIPELLIHGPAPGKQGYPLAGYGLFLDGKLAAYAERGEQLMIGAGANQNVAPDIVF